MNEDLEDDGYRQRDLALANTESGWVIVTRAFKIPVKSGFKSRVDAENYLAENYDD